MDIVVVIVVGGVCRPMDLPAIKNKRRAGPPVGDDDYHDDCHYVDDYGMCEYLYVGQVLCAPIGR